MLLLLFRIGDNRYALDAGYIVEVAPLLELTRMPHAPAGFAGIFNYHGQPVAALDLSELLAGRRAEPRLSTRMVIVRYRDANGAGRLLGLIAENATDMLRRNAEELLATGVKIRGAPYLGPVLLDSRGSIQLLHHDLLVPGAMVPMLPPLSGSERERASA